MQIFKKVHKKKTQRISSEVKIYQRAIEKARLNRIKKSIEKDGYWPQECIVLNQDMECVDGQHRLQATKDLGLEDIPCVIYRFDSLQEEAKMFSEINSYNTKLKPVDVWNSRKIWGDPIAEMVYRLQEDPTSPFHGIIKVKGNEKGKEKFTIPSIITLMCTVCFNLRAPHYKDTDKGISQRMQNQFKDLDYEEAIKKAAMFMQWFKVFADENISWYSQPSIPVLAIVYKSLIEQGKFSDPRKIRPIAQKLINFETNNRDWKYCPRSTKINMLSGHLIRAYRAHLSDFDPFKGSMRTE